MGFETLKNGTRVYTSTGDTVSVDSLMLAAFAPVRQRVLELGSGNAAMLLWVADRGLCKGAVGVELREDACRLAERSAAESNADIKIIRGDIRTFRSDAKFDLVLCNPPYYDASSGAMPAGFTADKRFENNGRFADFCISAAKNLKQKGSFCFCYPASRLANAFISLRSAGLEPKRLRFVRHSVGDEPYLVLCDARLSAGEGLRYEPDLVTRSDGEETAEYADITCEGKIKNE